MSGSRNQSPAILRDKCTSTEGEPTKKVLVGDLGGGTKAAVISYLAHIIFGIIHQLIGKRQQVGLQLLHLPLNLLLPFLILGPGACV